jgi:hypothetical protein
MFRVCSGPAPAVSYHAKKGHVCVAPVLVPLYPIGAPAPVVASRGSAALSFDEAGTPSMPKKKPKVEGSVAWRWTRC